MTNSEQSVVVRLVWHPRTSKLMFFGTGDATLLARPLFPIGEHSYAIFHPRDKTYRLVSIRNGQIRVTPGRDPDGEL